MNFFNILSQDQAGKIHGQAFLPAQMVEFALSRTPKNYTAAGWNPENAYEVHGKMELRLRCIGGAMKWISLSRKESRSITWPMPE
jgi:trimethylamine:corrinoid methyltransferase-like protein